jgi:hypothetical protein
VAHHARGKPRKVDLAPAFDDLAQKAVELRGVGAAHQVLCVHAGGVGEPGPGAGLDGIDGGLRVEVVKGRAGQGFSVVRVHHVVGRFTLFSIAARACFIRLSRQEGLKS